MYSRDAWFIEISEIDGLILLLLETYKGRREGGILVEERKGFVKRFNLPPFEKKNYLVDSLLVYQWFMVSTMT